MTRPKQIAFGHKSIKQPDRLFIFDRSGNFRNRKKNLIRLGVNLSTLRQIVVTVIRMWHVWELRNWNLRETRFYYYSLECGGVWIKKWKFLNLLYLHLRQFRVQLPAVQQQNLQNNNLQIDKVIFSVRKCSHHQPQQQVDKTKRITARWYIASNWAIFEYNHKWAFMGIWLYCINSIILSEHLNALDTPT